MFACEGSEGVGESEYIILNRNFSASVSSNGFASKRDRLSSRGLCNIVAIVQVDITDDDNIIVHNIV